MADQLRSGSGLQGGPAALPVCGRETLVLATSEQKCVCYSAYRVS
jgi:hypothetical protein